MWVEDSIEKQSWRREESWTQKHQENLTASLVCAGMTVSGLITVVRSIPHHVDMTMESVRSASRMPYLLPVVF